MSTYEERREGRRRFMRRNWPWIAPLALAAAAGVFVGVGFLVTWLWRVTLGDIFGFKAISFWQAWGLILLSQILFKANVRSDVSSRSGRRRCEQEAGRADGPMGGPVGI